MIILGLNAYHGDSSACIVVDGQLVAAVEEERFTRLKHWAGLPVQSIRYCLDEAGAPIEDVDYIAVNRDPWANYHKKAMFAFAKHPSLKLVIDRIRNAGKVGEIRGALYREFCVRGQELKFQILNVEHHVAHMASAFFISPFDEAPVVSVDGFGDFVGVMWGIGRGSRIEVKHRTFFPHSLGLFYLALTQYLGFHDYGDEYKVMGLSAYGEPEFMEEMDMIVTKANGHDSLFELGLKYFLHHSGGITMTWDNGKPELGKVFSEKLEYLLGPARKEGGDIDKKYRNVAASLQNKYEDVFFAILNHVYNETNSPFITLAGGCAMNSLANGKIFDNTPFKEVYIQPAAGDAGGAIGAAFYLYHNVLGKQRSYVLNKSYLGPSFNNDEIKLGLDANGDQLKKADCIIEKIDDTQALCRKVALFISEGNVIGWFQGRMEWGARALGNRSIVGDPRRKDMQDILNLKIKRRESFRPFAPSIHLDAVSEYFETSYPDPFMLKVYKIKPEKREIVPAVTHVDGTGRLQTVRKEDNPIYWQLIEEFRKITGVPVLLNTSFNENEPIVCKPEEALNCFLRTKMDVLVMGSYLVKRG